MTLTELFKKFFDSERAGGILLIVCTAASLVLANSHLSGNYLQFWRFELGEYSVQHWVNDGLMTVFFLLIGLELEREFYLGELSNLKCAAFPLIAAFGGMFVPAAIFLLFNFGTPTQAGAGIPMATDIAFAIGVLSLLGSRVPAALKVLLTAMAVIDDLGSIIVIAIFYTSGIAFSELSFAVGIFLLLVILNQLKVRNLFPYIIGGVLMWYFMKHSGVHPTITGVLLAIAIPFGDGSKKSPSYILQHWLHTPVAFFVLPLFALANTCLEIDSTWYWGLGTANSLGIISALVAGKPIGIFLFSFAAVFLGLCYLPPGINWKQIFGIGLLAGIGFTMSIFITLLAFTETSLVTESKIAILVASLIAGSLGFLWLRWTLKENRSN